MSHIQVCPLSKLDLHMSMTGASHVMCLIGHTMALERPGMIALERYLRVSISDIVPGNDGNLLPEHEKDGHVLPKNTHIHDIIAFSRQWDRKMPLLIHCYAGVSRSTAAAYISMLAIHATLDEHFLARRLRDLSPTATPNPHMIALADDILERGGRMVAAIRAIGRGEDCYEGVPFRFSL